MDNDPPDPGGDEDRLRLLLNRVTSSSSKKRPTDAQGDSGAVKKTIIDPTESSPSIQTSYIHPDHANKPTTYSDSDSGPFLVHVTRDVGDSSSGITTSTSKYKLSRRGRKLQVSDDQRTIVALPKDVPERTWMEILQKEETDLMVFDIREEIVDAAIEYCYGNYMERQNAIFTAHCAAQAWLKLINWQFYRHDPGEDPSAYPPCFIPKRRESWMPDEIPDSSPKDTWSQQDLAVAEDSQDESLQKSTSSISLEYPIVEDIPQEYWFPGKVQLSQEMRIRLELDRDVSYESSGSVATPSDEKIGTESEVLQKVTDYSAEELSKVSTMSALRNTTPVDGSLHGAGDSTMVKFKGKKDKKYMSRSFPTNLKLSSRLSKLLPPLDGTDSRSRISIISDCRLRNLRLDTHFEISSEILETPAGEVVKRK